MTRQPAAENRFTVACPMPRLAPVKSSVRRGWLECDVGIGSITSWIEPRFTPGLAQRCTTELDPIVQTEWPILPELHDQRHEPIAGPVRRPRNTAHQEFGCVERNRPLERVAALKRSRLLAGPGADLGKPRPRGEIGIRLGIVHPDGRAAQSNLPVQR